MLSGILLYVIYPQGGCRLTDIRHERRISLRPDIQHITQEDRDCHRPDTLAQFPYATFEVTAIFRRLI